MLRGTDETGSPIIARFWRYIASKTCIHLCPHESASDANCSPSVTPNLALNMQTGITESVKDATVYVSSELGETVPRKRDHDRGLIPASNHYDRGASSSCPPIPPSGTRTETRPRLARTSRAREPSGTHGFVENMCPFHKRRSRNADRPYGRQRSGVLDDLTDNHPSKPRLP